MSLPLDLLWRCRIELVAMDLLVSCLYSQLGYSAGVFQARGLTTFWLCHVELVLGKTISDKLVWEWRKPFLYHMTTIIKDYNNSWYIFPPKCFSLSYFCFYLSGHMQWNACIRWRLYVPLSFLQLSALQFSLPAIGRIFHFIFVIKSEIWLINIVYG